MPAILRIKPKSLWPLNHGSDQTVLKGTVRSIRNAIWFTMDPNEDMMNDTTRMIPWVGWENRQRKPSC